MNTSPRNTRPYDNVLDTIGWTPLIRLNRVTRGIRTPVYAQGRVLQSRRHRQGPHRAADHRAGRARGRAQAGRHDRRRHERQHRRRARDRGGAQGLQVHLHDARQDVAGEGAAAQGVRRRGDHHADGGAARSSRQLRDDGQAHRAGDAERDSREPVLQSANPEAHYDTTGPELWEQIRRQDHALRRRGWNRRHDHRRRPLFLKEKNPKIKIIAGDPVGSILAEFWRSKGERKPEGVPYKVEGIGQDKIPGTLDMSVIDDFRTVSDAIRSRWRAGSRARKDCSSADRAG